MEIKKCKRCKNPKRDPKWNTILTDFKGDYCSPKCRYDLNKNITFCSFEYCGETFEKNANRQKYCSANCRYENQLLRQKRKYQNAK